MIPEDIQKLISANASVIEVRCAILKEIDRDLRRQGNLAAQIALDANRSMGGDLLEEDDGVVDFTNLSDPDQRICEVMAALRINFSIEKVKYAGVVTDLLRGKRNPSISESKKCMPEDTTVEQERVRGTSSSDAIPRDADPLMSGIDELCQKLKGNGLSLADLKIQLSKLILKELDRDQRRDPMLAVRTAVEANTKLESVGESLFETDDGAVEFPQVTSPVTREDKLDEVKASLRLNFSKEKIEYAESLIKAFRTRGLDGFQIKRQSTARTPGQTMGGVKSSNSHTDARRDSPRENPGRSTGRSSSRAANGYEEREKNSRMSAKITWTVIVTAIAALVALVVRKFK